MVKILDTNEAILEKKQLEDYLAKLASDNVLTKNSDLSTYPIPRLKENCEYISLVYTLLNEHAKLGIEIHPAGEWILDNFYIIEKQAKNIEKDLTKKKYIKFPGLVNSGFARIYVLANEIVSNTDSNIEPEDLLDYLVAYQTQKNLTMEEIWSVGIFLQICIIEKIRHICEKISISQIQKYKVNSIIERLIEGKKENKFDNFIKSQNKNYLRLGQDGEYQFIEYMSYRLKKYGKKAIPYLSAFNDEVIKTGTNLEEIVTREHFDIAVKRLSMKNCITSLKKISKIDIIEIFKKINAVEKILIQDPAKVYENMDYTSKAYYRMSIISIAEKTKLSEIFVAQNAYDLAKYNYENYDNKNNYNKDDKKIDNEKENSDNNSIYEKYKQSKENYNNAKTSKKSHIGYYLIDKGKEQLLSKLLNKKVHYISNDSKSKLYVFIIFLFSIIITALLSVNLTPVMIILFIPIINAITLILRYILNKCVKTKIIPKINLEDKIPKDTPTMCILPVMLKDKNDVDEMFKKMEIYYNANKSENIYFTLLGDCSTSSSEYEIEDSELIKEGIKCASLLNKKYGEIFFFTYRKREWSDTEQCYMGWERKRGIINQFNEYLETGKSKFQINTCRNLPKIKYVISIDSDTNLTLNSASKLVGAMSHILNQPKIDKVKNIVTEGHAIIQPRIGLDIEDGNKTIFNHLFAGNAGTDFYTNAISDVYQDNFEEGIYTGKGIYDLDTFYNVLRDSIPENQVLSHDLLEGCFLRCGLASDILLLDNYPSNYEAYKTRKGRWIRGDVQIFPWLKSKLNFLSKYKIIDNVIRNSNDIFLLIVLLIGMFVNSLSMTITPIIILAIPLIIKLIDIGASINIDSNITDLYSNSFKKWQKDVLIFLTKLALIPDEAVTEITSIFKSWYRMNFTHNFMLEWITADDAEKKSNTKLVKYYDSMIVQVILGIIFIINSISFIIINYKEMVHNSVLKIATQQMICNPMLQNTIPVITNMYLTNDIPSYYNAGMATSIITLIIGIMWLILPMIMCKISQKKKKQKFIEGEDREYLIKIASKTWKYFKDNMINYLPVDNYQDDRKEKVIKRTSPTNIGLEILSAIASYDLGFESLEDTVILITNIINTIERLDKWNGHLYNWYDIETLKPVIPLDISSVDSGNLVGYLYTAKSFLINSKKLLINSYLAKIDIKNKKENEKKSQLKINSKKEIDNKKSLLIDIDLKEITKNVDLTIQKIQSIIDNTDFSKLYNSEIELFSIGFNINENKLYDSYYDLLASEARQASIIAIAKKDVTEKNWSNLSRTLTKVKEKNGLVSWGGTAFEYLMPNINIPVYKFSLLYDSCMLLINSQILYAKKLGIPWGMSESAYSKKDLYGNYQYKTFGIPWLGIKRGLMDEVVVSPYSTAMSLPLLQEESMENLYRLEKEGAIGEYGFYDAIDYLPKKSIVKTYMAHHQGMIITSIDNAINDNIFQKRFMENPEIEGTKILLEETMPDDVIITKEKKDKTQKIRYRNNEDDYKRTAGTNVIATRKYTNVSKEDGKEYSQIDDIVIYKNFNLYVKDINTKKIWNFKNTKRDITYNSYSSKEKIEEGNIKIIENTTIAPDCQLEIKEISIKNKGITDLNLEVTTTFDPIISNKEQYNAHPTFDKMFLRYKQNDKYLIITRKPRINSEKIEYVTTTFFDNENEIEYEIDKEKLCKREKNEIPKEIQESIPFYNKIEQPLEPVVAMRKIIKVKPNKTNKIYVIISASSNENKSLENAKDYSNIEKLNRVFELSKVQTEAENRYMEVKGKDVSVYQQMLEKLLFSKNYIKDTIKDNIKIDIDLSNRNLWKYGISGEKPIIEIIIKDENDIYVLEELLKAYEYFLSKNIITDIIIISQIKDSYIENMIQKYKYYGGKIVILNEISREEKKVIEMRANIIIDAHSGGSLSVQISENQNKGKK